MSAKVKAFTANDTKRKQMHDDCSKSPQKKLSINQFSDPNNETQVHCRLYDWLPRSNVPKDSGNLCLPQHSNIQNKSSLAFQIVTVEANSKTVTIDKPSQKNMSAQVHFNCTNSQNKNTKKQHKKSDKTNPVQCYIFRKRWQT